MPWLVNMCHAWALHLYLSLTMRGRYTYVCLRGKILAGTARRVKVMGNHSACVDVLWR